MRFQILDLPKRDLIEGFRFYEDKVYHGCSMSHPLYELLWKLDGAKIHFTLSRHRPDTILVTLTLVGERVEVDVFDDGHMDVSRFPGSEEIVGGAELVEKLINENRS